ncbi:dTDP-4-dehydrorhamnose 3,5-epimerase-like enzyme [Kitasatospora sp. MAP12-15]|nr:dTDP-4-dehydrorhamnose 3,5-epimerase-like enzyme [Kitasatospora sp. MAP12-44]
MEIRELTIAGACEIIPRLHGDQRRLFTEWYRFDPLAEAVGRPLRLAQARCWTWWSI